MENKLRSTAIENFRQSQRVKRRAENSEIPSELKAKDITFKDALWLVFGILCGAILLVEMYIFLAVYGQ